VKNLVLWGGVNDGNSLRYIWRAFYLNAHKIGIRAIWADDMPDARQLLVPGTTVISADIWSEHIGEAMPEVDYVLHNYSSDHPLCQTVEPERLLRLQVYTSDARGDEWAPFRLYDRDGRVLYQVWGVDLLPEEFLEPVFNPQSQDAVFVGAVWSEQYQGTELGNRDVIEETRLALADHGLKFRVLTQLSDAEMVEAVRSARIAPAFAGGWQVEHDLIPCRTLKAPAYGVLSLTNVPAVQTLFGGWSPTPGSVAEMIDSALALRRKEYLGVVREQQRAVAPYSYRESLQAIERALELGREPALV
jgi:hypothetical protein